MTVLLSLFNEREALGTSIGVVMLLLFCEPTFGTILSETPRLDQQRRRHYFNSYPGIDSSARAHVGYPYALALSTSVCGP